MEKQKLIRLEAKSTPSFIRTAFDCYRSHKLFAVVRADTADDARLVDAQAQPIDTGEASGWIDERLELNWSDMPAQLVFSSGTEGRPKAFLLSHRNLADVVARLNEAMEVTSEIREYIGVPVTYSFGLGRARAVATAGGRSYIPERFDPAEIARMLAAGEINAFSSVPSLCRILLKSKELFADVGEKVRWIEIGSQYMSADEKLEMRALFPKARILQHYGLTEGSRSTFLDISRAAPQDLGSVGHVGGPVEVRINDEGAICLRGQHVALGQLTVEGAIASLTDDDGWLVTKDRGEIRGGALYFLGRLDDQINISGIKVSADQLEESLRAAVPEYAGHFAIAAIEDPLRGQMALLVGDAAVGAEMSALEAALEAVMSRFGVSGGDGFRTMSVETLPTTGSGKVQRAALKEQYQAQAVQNRDAGTTVKGVFQKNFPRADITSATTFQNLGGDSLSYVSVSLDLEALLGTLPARWEELPVEKLEKIVPSESRFARMDMPTALRALSICLIVLGHFDAFEYGGTGAFALFFIAGLNFAGLTIPSVVQSANLTPALVLLMRIAILAWIFMSLNWIVTGYGSAVAYLFITNWLGPEQPGGVWFVGVYIQIVLLLAVFLSFAEVRRWIAARAFETCAGLTALMIVAMTISELTIDTHHLFRRLPHILGWMFSCGMTIYYADSVMRKLICLVLLVAGYSVFSNFGLPDFKYVMLAVPVLIFIPYVVLPRFVIPVVRVTAGASLVIYLSHFAFRSSLEKVMIPSPLLASVFAITGGVAAYVMYQPIDNRIRRVLQAWMTPFLGLSR